MSLRVTAQRDFTASAWVFGSVLRNERIHHDSLMKSGGFMSFPFRHSSFLSHSRGFYLLPRSCLCTSIAMAASGKARNVL